MVVGHPGSGSSVGVEPPDGKRLSGGLMARPPVARAQTADDSTMCRIGSDIQNDVSDFGRNVRILSKSTLRVCWERHPAAKVPLLAWYREVEREGWGTPAELLARYPRASIVRGGRVVFRIKGNDYRLVAWINYAKGMVYVKFVGTHAEYDRVNAEEV